MFAFNVEQWVPRFILNDKNGYAIAKAIEIAMQAMDGVVKNGLACISDFDTMPEWRLDELAWEYNILYDYHADIEVKREWIRNARDFYSLYGTPAGVIQYLAGMFGTTSLEEGDQYGGEPFHFRVVVTGEYNEENDAWARKAVEATKNVRSVLDNILFNSGGVTVPLNVAAAVCGIDINEEVTMYD